ncbi:YkvA family protein [Knoellia koreensis]|nr:DUF1232 domain-containing protein [Knoellia sp. DB2414S]
MAAARAGKAARWGMFRTLASAIRTAARPGSPSMQDRLAAVPRLIRATFTGEYHGATKGRLFLIAAAVAYVVSPVDFVPEALLGVFGLADDAFVVSWIAAAVINETESFLAWERATPSGRSGGARSAWGAATDEPVYSKVVR